MYARIVGTYKEEMIKAMQLLSRNPTTIFIGQNIKYEGSPAYETLQTIPDSRKIEMPVAEDMQLGICIGLSLSGFLPICIFPRMDFMMRAMDQLVNHLDKMEDMTNQRFTPHVIIRTIIGATKPLYPGEQHCQDYTEGLQAMLARVKVHRLEKAEDIVPKYREALNRIGESTILVEYAEKIRGG
ncbi:hypothetical protein LCGC14_1282470 [marine sediment metagenome]|uniref:Transketolase-like pyrimidine-binding domain-containing protein n=1 Tax=marine sediment metagenome TaxID=412755 RepID=A0A0F9LFV4_9ZZZZ